MHQFKDILIAIANCVPLQVRVGTDWNDIPSRRVLRDLVNNYGVGGAEDRYRVKPNNIKIGSVEVPAPLRCYPEIGDSYYTVMWCWSDDATVPCTFNNDDFDKSAFDKNMAFASKEDCGKFVDAVSKLLAA